MQWHPDKKYHGKSVYKTGSNAAIHLRFQFYKCAALQKTIDTKIEKATVFLNGAQINRSKNL